MTTSLSFTEEMNGHVALGEAEDFEHGRREGEKSGNAILFRVTITIDDVDRFVAERTHEAKVEGYIECDVLGGRLPISTGAFNLLVDDENSDRKLMLYRLYFRDGTDNALTLSGFKTIKDDPGFDLWSDNTTLYTKILRGHVGVNELAFGETAAQGILRIHVPEFLKQLTTFEATGGSLEDRATALTKFTRFFLGKLWDSYARDVLKSKPE